MHFSKKRLSDLVFFSTMALSLILTIVAFCINSDAYEKLLNIESSWLIIGIFFLLLAHIFRIVRLFLIFMERKLKMTNLLRVYVLTTFANNVIPFKLGEFFRISEYSNLSGSFKMGLMSIWVDRFFDTVVLIFTLTIVSLSTGIQMVSLIVLLIGFVIVSLFAYLSFMPTYEYIKNVMLTKSNSKKGIFVLNTMAYFKDFYCYAKELVKGKTALLFLISMLIWLFEIIAYSFILRQGTLSNTFTEIASVLNNIGISIIFKDNNLNTNIDLITYVLLFVSSIVVLLGYFRVRKSIVLMNLKSDEIYKIID